MGFDSEYKKHVKEGYEYKLPGEKSTILPFFGFKYTADNNYRIAKGDYTVSEVNRRIRISKQPDVILPDGETACFYRYEEPEGKAKVIEDKIYNLLEKKYRMKDWNMFDPFKTPYLEPSIKHYYEANITTIVQSELKLEKTKWFVNVLVYLLLPVIICIIAGVIIHSVPLFAGALAFGVVDLILCGHILGKEAEKYKSKYYFSLLSKKHKELIRTKYLETLTVNDKEIDPLLREYATLRGYDYN